MYLLILLSLLSVASAQDCPEKNQAPLCPNSGSTLLDDTYPVQAFVISTEGTKTKKKGDKSSQAYHESNIELPAKFVTSVMLSYSKDSPEIIVPTYAEDFEELKAAVTKNLKNAKVTQQEIDIRISKMKLVELN